MVEPEHNITSYLYDFARAKPEKAAFLHPVKCSFGRLVTDIDRISSGFRDAGIAQGTRTVVLIKPGLDLFAVTFSLFRIGAVPILIDPGMGRSRMVDALSTVGATAFVGIPRSHLLKFFFPAAFQDVGIWISTGFSWLRKGISVRKMRYRETSAAPCFVDPEDLVAIFFTSGSTGPPKGVCYTSRMLRAQIELMKTKFQYHPDEIDLCTFPLIGLLVISHGISIVLADMDMLHPARLIPSRVIRNIQDYKCTHMFCSPMVLQRLASYGIKRDMKLDSLKRIMTAGAPVLPSVLRDFRRMLPAEAELHTPYGATEALPVTDILDGELIELYNESDCYLEGICIGYPLEGIDVKVISIQDGPLSSQELESVPANGIGEIILTGPNVTELYWKDDRANQLAKITDRKTGRIWHRMGDLGRMDHKGRLWFYGRKSQRVVSGKNTLFTIPVEAVFNQHPDVLRSALVGVDKGDGKGKIPVICVEYLKSKKRKIYLQDELREMAKQYDITEEIEEFQFYRKFPVDPRHNAKIYREELTRWTYNRLLK